MEVLKAVEQSIPVYAFVDDKVMHDHHVYERNKDKVDIIDQIEFPSIQKRETAKYIFEFINFLTHRVTNNSITSFTRLEEIRLHLLSQWSQLLQRLLMESRTKTKELRRYRDFSERLDDLKAVVMASLATPDLRETAKGAIQFRTLIRFVSGLRFVDNRTLLLSGSSWDQILQQARIVEVRTVNDDDRPPFANLYLVLDDKTFYNCRYPQRILDDLRLDWASFQKIEPHSREAIVDALLEDREARRMSMLRYVDKNIEEYMVSRASVVVPSEPDSSESA